MLRVASGVVDQKVSFMANPSFATGAFVVNRSRNGANSATFVTPTLTLDPNVAGMFHFTMDEDMSLDPGHVTEQMLFIITHPDDPGWKYQKEIELFIPSALRKNQAFSNFTFVLISSVDHVSPIVGMTVTAERSIDGAAFASCSNAVSAIGAGVYKIDLTAADLNGNTITLKFTAVGADARLVTLIPARA